MRFRHCHHCGSPVEERPTGDEGLTPWCPRCEKPLFDLFFTCIIALVVNARGECALLRQGYISHRYANLVSGYIKPGENAEETARREIGEELGLSVSGLEFAGTYWFGKKEMLMIGFFAHTEETELRPSGEVDAVCWAPLRDALGQVHPEGSLSHTLIRAYLDAYGEGGCPVRPGPSIPTGQAL